MIPETPTPAAPGPPDEAVLEAATRLLRHATGLMLASCDAHGQPLASYAPFVIADGALNVFVSRLAAHSASLRRERPVSVMLIEDQAAARQPFARVRLTGHCQVRALAPGAGRTLRGLDALHRRFGAVVETLRQLPDFTLYRLSPCRARFVQGFGQAFALERRHLSRILEGAGV